MAEAFIEDVIIKNVKLFPIIYNGDPKIKKKDIEAAFDNVTDAVKARKKFSFLNSEFSYETVLQVSRFFL